MIPLATLTVTGGEACPSTLTTTVHEVCPATASGIKALSCQPVTPFVTTGPELYEIAAGVPHTDTLAPPSVNVFAVVHWAARPRFCPKMVNQVFGGRGSDLKSAPLTMPFDGTEGV